MDRDYIALALLALGLEAQDWGPDISSYEALLSGWRGSVDCPSKSELQAVESAVDDIKAAEVKRFMLIDTSAEASAVLDRIYSAGRLDGVTLTVSETALLNARKSAKETR